MQGLGKLETGGRVLMDDMLDALAELLIDLVVDIFLHGNLGKQLEALLRRLSLKNLDCWRVSRGRLSGKSSESAASLTKSTTWHEIIAVIRQTGQTRGGEARGSRHARGNGRLRADSALPRAPSRRRPQVNPGAFLDMSGIQTTQKLQDTEALKH